MSLRKENGRNLYKRVILEVKNISVAQLSFELGLFMLCPV